MAIDYAYTLVRRELDITTSPDSRETYATIQKDSDFCRYIYEAPKDVRGFLFWVADNFDSDNGADIWVTIPDPDHDTWDVYQIATTIDDLIISRN